MIENINKLLELESTINIVFKDKELLMEAMTHSSYKYENNTAKYNERLEFLGDSVLQLCVSEYLFNNYPEKSEGELTKIRALIVCENSLFEVSQELQLGNFISMSKGEELTGGRTRVSILADCVEALLAAIYLDSGLKNAKKFIYRNFHSIIKKAIENKIVLDYKTKLQELLQQNGEVSIVYNLIDCDGPPHRRLFSTEVVINNKVQDSGSGYSKKEAEQSAAKIALTALEEKTDE